MRYETMFLNNPFKDIPIIKVDLEDLWSGGTRHGPIFGRTNHSMSRPGTSENVVARSRWPTSGRCLCFNLIPTTTYPGGTLYWNFLLIVLPGRTAGHIDLPQDIRCLDTPKQITCRTLPPAISHGLFDIWPSQQFTYEYRDKCHPFSFLSFFVYSEHVLQDLLLETRAVTETRWQSTTDNQLYKVQTRVYPRRCEATVITAWRIKKNSKIWVSKVPHPGSNWKLRVLELTYKLFSLNKIIEIPGGGLHVWELILFSWRVFLHAPLWLVN